MQYRSSIQRIIGSRFQQLINHRLAGNAHQQWQLHFEKFSKILSKKQLYQLKQAEAKFTREMISKAKNKNKK